MTNKSWWKTYKFIFAVVFVVEFFSRTTSKNEVNFLLFFFIKLHRTNEFPRKKSLKKNKVILFFYFETSKLLQRFLVAFLFCRNNISLKLFSLKLICRLFFEDEKNWRKKRRRRTITFFSPKLKVSCWKKIIFNFLGCIFLQQVARKIEIDKLSPIYFSKKNMKRTWWKK